MEEKKSLEEMRSACREADAEYYSRQPWPPDVLDGLNQALAAAVQVLIWCLHQIGLALMLENIHARHLACPCRLLA
jgi:hypothetical protein